MLILILTVTVLITTPAINDITLSDRKFIHITITHIIFTIS